MAWSMLRPSRWSTLPLSIYEGFVREHAYGLSNQTFLAWLGDFATSFAVTLIARGDRAAAFCMPPSARRGETWWLWGSGIVILFHDLLL